MRVKDLMKKYDGKTVVNSVSFEIPKGKVLSLIGPNGAGKSTVMGMLSRLIARDSGMIDFEGQDVASWKSKEPAAASLYCHDHCSGHGVCPAG